MKAETPAEGILKIGEWGGGDSKWYHIRCECGSDDCSHELNVEADEVEVSVHIYANSHTKWWQKKRWQQIWQILTRGYAEMQTTIVFNEKVAINYANALISASKDVKVFSEHRLKEREKK